MNNQLILAKLNDPWEGYVLYGGEEKLFFINGNHPTYHGPVALLSLNPSTVYGMSQTKIIEKILDRGPQQLLTTRDISHTLYEHGMKSCWGRVNIGSNTFLTNLQTFYVPLMNHQNLNAYVITGIGQSCALLVEYLGKQILIQEKDFKTNTKIEKEIKVVTLEEVNSFSVINE